MDSSILPGKQDENFKSWSPSLFVAGAVTSRNSLPFKAVAQTNYGNRSESPSSKNYSIIINRQSSFSSPPADDRSNATRSGSHSPSRSDNSQSGSSTPTSVTISLNSRSESMDLVRSGSSGSPPVGQADKPEPSKEDLTGDDTSPNEILHIKTSKMVINLNKYFIINK